VAVSGRGPDAACRVWIAEPAVSEGQDGVLLLAAVVVLFPLACGGSAGKGAAPDRGSV
jgi:hypothetical protein